MASEAIVRHQPSPDMTREQVDLIKSTVARGTSDDELKLFLYTARRTGLDPLTKQIHAIKRWNSKEGREVMTIQTGIDGYRVIAERSGQLAGIDDAVFDTDTEPFPGKASVTVYKMIAGQRCPFTASARWIEYVQTTKEGNPTQMWKKMPYLMLGKCAEALALRKAFPADLSGVYTFEEMSQADVAEEAKPVVIPPKSAVETKASADNLTPESEASTSTVDLFFRKVDEPTQTRSKKPMLTGLMAPIEGADLWFCFDTKLWPDIQKLEQQTRKCSGRWMKKGFVIEKVMPADEPLEINDEDRKLVSGDFFDEPAAQQSRQ